MKTSLQHLPEVKKEDLEIITEVVKQRVNPEMIILFGSHARGDWVDDTYREDGITYQYKSDYDILVVTEKPTDAPPALTKKLRYKIRRADWLNTPITLIFHDIKYLNEELEEGSYFFVDILREGVLLYDSGKFKLSEPRQLTTAQRAEKARLYLKKWHSAASGFS